MARQDPSKSRVTPKGTHPTGPSSKEPVTIDPPSPTWVPVLMFVLLGVGTLVILLNYTVEILGMPSNWYLLGGLGLVLAGIITATQYR